MATNDESRINRRKQKKSVKKPLWKRIFLIGAISILTIGLGIGALFTYYIVTAPSIDASELDSPYASTFYDMDGDAIGDIVGSENRSKVNYDELPDVLTDAVLSTEDTRFFEHPGIDIYRIGGAILANIKNGFGSEGGSTITQQLVEKSFLSPEKKIGIKVQEMWLALKLERQYSKKEILEFYLNKIYYGNGAYGVGKASELYFGKKDLSKLTLPEAAILAGLPQRPSGYNPFKHPDVMKDRMNTVLNRMVDNDAITKKEAKEAKNVDIQSLLTDDEPQSTPYQAFLERVNEEVKEKVDGADIYTDGLDIYTTIDTDAQDHVEFLLSDSDNNPINYPAPVTDEDGNEHKVQAGMTVLDTETGAIRAIGGARGGVGDGWNYATMNKRQPGSTFKPIMAYGPAIENKQWSTYHQLNDDGPIEVGGDTISTWAGQYYGQVSARFALQQSLNVPTVKTFQKVGADKAEAFAEGLGLTPDEGEDLVPSDAIGGGKIGTNPLEMAGAYRAFANGGVYNEPYAVKKVEFPESERTVDLTPEPEAAMSESTAYMITDMLKSVINEGTGTQANVQGLPDAGKTGTSSDDIDAWFNGYTTNYTISAWTGYPNNDGKRRSLPDTKISQELYKHTMSEISKGVDTPDFTKPESVVEADVVKGSKPAKRPNSATPSSDIVTELFVKGTAPEEVSEKVKQMEPVNDLEAEYEEDDNIIDVQWDYDSDIPVSFEVYGRIDDGEMQKLSTTQDDSMEITNVGDGSTYEIQVVAVSDGENIKSEPVSTTVQISGEDEEDDENIPPVSGLNARPSNSNIDVSWQYDGPEAQFDVTVTKEGNQIKSQTTDSEGIIIEGAQPGSYTITVTPIGRDEGNKGESASTNVNIEQDEDNNQNENENSNQEQQGNQNGQDQQNNQSQQNGQNQQHNQQNQQNGQNGQNGQSGQSEENQQEQNEENEDND